MSKLSGIPFQRSVLSIATPDPSDVTPQESVSHVSAPVASQLSLSAEEPPVALSSSNHSPTPIPLPASSANATATGSGLPFTPLLSRRAAKVDPVKIRESLMRGEIPDAYVVTEDWGPEDVKYVVHQVMKLRDEENKRRGDMPFVPRVVTGKDGIERVRSHQIRLTIDAPSSEIKAFIQVTEVEYGVRNVKQIIPDQLPLYEEHGWEEWFLKHLTDEERAERERVHIQTLAFHNLINE